LEKAPVAGNKTEEAHGKGRKSRIRRKVAYHHAKKVRQEIAPKKRK